MENTAIEQAGTRNLTGAIGIVQKAIFVAIPLSGAFFVLDGPFYLNLMLQRPQYYALFLGLVLAGVCLTIPANSKASRTSVPWYDLVLGALGLTACLYMAIFYEGILMDLGKPDTARLLMGGVTILLVLETARRAAGWILPVIGIVFILYARFADLAPGDFSATATDWPRLINYLYADTNSLFGLPLGVSAAVVLGFIFFGEVLFAVGAGDFLQSFTMVLLGRFRGGPAKMAVVSSSLFGTISGAAVSNVAVTGSFTIPLMKSHGYRPTVAGAVEAVASTGGQLMPPVMGAAAFLMADFLSVPYAEIARAALLPAILYYLVLFVQVDLEAGKFGLRGLSRDQLPSLTKAIRLSWLFVIPLATLMILLFSYNWEPGKSGFAAAFVAVGLGLAVPSVRGGYGKWILRVLQSTGRTMLELGAIVGIAGFVIGSIQVSGLAFNLSTALVHLAQGSLILLLMMTAIVCIILGMGMTTTAVYVLLAVVVGPALTEMGIRGIAAHLFIFYYGMLSMISPPICMAAYAAATIAKSNFWTTGYQAMRLGIVAYILPFLFVFSPALLLQGPLDNIILSTVTAVAGAALLGVATTGYLLRSLTWPKRLALGFSAVFLLIPAGIGGSGVLLGLFELGQITDVLGIVIAAPLLFREWQARKLAPVPAVR
ncbi:MAG: TRAP transporter fused permease subunit [Chloroflexi bacterium]|nr:TRAP transporter fused permease subunit [Chloroflexota bacterium]